MLFKFIYQHFTMGYSERQLIGILDVLKSIARKPNFFCLRFICSVLRRRRISWQSFLDKHPGLNHENYIKYIIQCLIDCCIISLRASFLLIKSSVTDLNTAALGQIPRHSPSAESRYGAIRVRRNTRLGERSFRENASAIPRCQAKARR